MKKLLIWLLIDICTWFMALSHNRAEVLAKSHFGYTSKVVQRYIRSKNKWGKRIVTLATYL